MSQILKTRVRGTLMLLFVSLLMTGCVEYTIETTLNPDGGGLRVEQMDATGDGEDAGISAESFPGLMHTTEADGWTHSEEVEEDGEVYHRFQRRTRIEELSDWSELNDKVRISGAVMDGARKEIGYVSLGEVRFRNAIHVRRSADSDGNVSFVFRETFTWEKAVDALAEFLMQNLEDSLAAHYPAVTGEERSEIVGFARSRFWVAVDEGLFTEDGDEDELLTDAGERTAHHALNIVKRRYPQAEEASLTQLMVEALSETDDEFVEFIEEDLPGLNIAINSEITFRLNMPGRVTDSNAHNRDGTTLEWEFGPGDAFSGPVEIYAESVVGSPTRAAVGRGTTSHGQEGRP